MAQTEQSRIVWDPTDESRRPRASRPDTIIFSQLAEGYYARLRELGCQRCPRCRDYVMLEAHACVDWAAATDRERG
jgi:hypothetical protein